MKIAIPYSFSFVTDLCDHCFPVLVLLCRTIKVAKYAKIYRPNVIIIILTQQRQTTDDVRKANNTGYCYKIYIWNIKYSKVHKFSRNTCVWLVLISINCIARSCCVKPWYYIIFWNVWTGVVSLGVLLVFFRLCVWYHLIWLNFINRRYFLYPQEHLIQLNLI